MNSFFIHPAQWIEGRAKKNQLNILNLVVLVWFNLIYIDKNVCFCID